MHHSRARNDHTRTLWILQTLINAHDCRIHALHESNHLSEVMHSSRAKEMHDSQVAAPPYVSNKGLALLLGGFRVGP